MAQIHNISKVSYASTNKKLYEINLLNAKWDYFEEINVLLIVHSCFEHLLNTYDRLY